MALNISENTLLKSFNTFGIAASSRFFCEANSVEDLKELMDNKIMRDFPHMILGGGSNVLFTRDFDGLVIRISLPGIVLVAEDEDYFYVKAGAGENWHGFVQQCIQKGYAGIENLSLIPGNVGAAPMQNIGAYGVELKDVFHSLDALHIQSGSVKTFKAEECGFGYRTSVFKTSEKGNFILISVTLRLRKKPAFNTSYGAIEKELGQLGIQDLTIKNISQAVINIRQSKLPDPKEIGNAGSFFKNPVIDTALFNDLKKEFPEIVGYRAGEKTKVAAGWLIEKAGWKGKTFGTYGVHKRQSLVLVNYGGSTGSQIYDLSENVLNSVKETFGIALEREVNII